MLRTFWGEEKAKEWQQLIEVRQWQLMYAGPLLAVCANSHDRKKQLNHLKTNFYFVLMRMSIGMDISLQLNHFWLQMTAKSSRRGSTGCGLGELVRCMNFGMI